MFRVALLAVTASLLLPAAAQANWELTADGNPLITLRAGQPADTELRVCAPGAAECARVEWTTSGSPFGVYAPGETAVGTTFEVTRLANGFVERSPAWQGRVTAPSAPSIVGKAIAGGHVAPVGVAWTGGWGDDVSMIELAACVAPDGVDCLALPPAAACPFPCRATPPEGRGPSSGSRSAALPPVVAGRYLMVSDTRLPRDQRGWPMPAIAAWSFQTRFNLARTLAWPKVLSAPVQIAPEPAPVLTLRRRALRGNGRLNVGRISCEYACKVSVKVSGGKEKAYTTTFVARRAAQAIKVPVRRGKLTVRVHADGKLLASGTVTAR